MTLNREPTSTWGGRQGNLRCEHDYPALVVENEAGYYARCLGCLPQDRSARVAKQQGKRYGCWE